MVNERTISQLCQPCDGLGEREVSLAGVESSIDEQMLMLCDTCEGSGRVNITLTPLEWQKHQRKKRLRGLFLLLLALLPLILLASAIFTRDSQYVCGSTWYGLLTFSLLLAL